MAVGDVRAIRLYGDQKVETGYSSAAALKAGPLTLRVVSKRLEFDRVPHYYVSLQSATYDRLVIGANSSPWAIATVRPVEGAAAVQCTVSGYGSDDLDYTEWVAVYTPKAGAVDGSLKLYRNGVYNTTVAVTATDSWSGDIKIVIGGNPWVANAEQAYQHCEVGVWSAALSAPEIAAMYHTSLSVTTPPQAASLLWYSRASKVLDAGLIVPDAGSLTTLHGTMDAGVTLVADVPTWAGTPDYVDLPTAGTVSVSASTTTGLTLSAGAGSSASGNCSRVLFISKTSTNWRYSVTARAVLPTDGTALVDYAVTGLTLTAGTKYYAIVRYEGPNGLRSEASASFVVPGTLAPLTGTQESLHITSNASATPVVGTGDVFHTPYNCDVTMRCFIKRAVADTSGIKSFMRFFDSGYYWHLALGINAYDQVRLYVQSGDANGSATLDASTTLPKDTWEEIWAIYKHPTDAVAGYAKIYRVVSGVLTQLATVALSTDAEYWQWKKLRGGIAIGGYQSGAAPAGTDYRISEMAIWTKALSTGEMGALAGLSLSNTADATICLDDLYWYSRPIDATTVVTPDLGAAVGAVNMIPDPGVSLGAVALEPPLANGAAYDADVPTFGTPSPPATPAVATSLLFTTEPSGVVRGNLFGCAVEVLDADGVLYTDTVVAVTVALQAGAGTLTGTKTVNTVAGVATFTNLVIDTAGAGCVLRASSGTLVTDDTAAFTVAVPSALTVTADRLEPTKVRLTWPTDATTIDTYYQIFIEGSATPLVDRLTNHVPAYTRWDPQIAYTVGELTPGQSYRFIVRRVQGGAWNIAPAAVPVYVGGTSYDSAACVVTLPADVPHQPLNAHLMDKASLSVTLRCAHSDDANAQGTATKYGLFAKLATDANYPTTPTVDSLTPVAATIGSFVTVTYTPASTAARDYQFRAYNANGWSEPSNTIRITADAGPTDVATFAAFKSALASARPGDIVRLTAAMTMDTTNTPVVNGAVIDLGGYTHEYTATTTGVNRIFASPASYLTYGTQIRNGTIHVSSSITAPVYGFYLLNGGDGVTMVDFHLTGTCQAFFKMDSQLGVKPWNRHLGCFDCSSVPQSTTTVFDIGPVACEDGVVWGYEHNQASVTGTSTTADGIANEIGYGFWDLRNVTIVNVNGDGIDMKFVGDFYMADCTAQGIARNSQKIWGVASSRFNVVRPKTIACGMDAYFGAGTGTVTDGYYEAYGFIDSNGNLSQTDAMNWGNGRMDNGLPGYGGVVIEMNHCNFRRKAATYYSVSALTTSDSNDAYPLEAGGPSSVHFTDCLWYQEGGHASVLTSKATTGSSDVSICPAVTVANAMVNNFPANHTNSTWANEDWSGVTYNSPPIVTVSGSTSGTVGVLAGGTYTAVDPEADALTITSGLSVPSGSSAALTATGGAWSFTPDVAGSYVVTITASDATHSTSATRTVVVAPAVSVPTTVEFTSVPVSVTMGVTTTITVDVLDADGVLYTTPVPVTLAVQTGPGAIYGTLTQLTVQGVATFADIAFSAAGTVTLSASTPGAAVGYCSAITVIEAPVSIASSLSFTAEPSGAAPGVAFTGQPVITVLDDYGDPIPWAGDITVAIKPGTGTFGAVLGGTVTLTVADGIATFTDLSIDVAGTGYALTATATGLAFGDSAVFDVTLPAWPLTAYDAAVALAGLIASNAATLNANSQLASTAYSVSTAASVADGDTSPYRYIKVGDRDILPDNALTICCVPIEVDPNGNETCNGVDYEAKVEVIAYLMGTADPADRETARAGIAAALRKFLNSVPNRVVTPAGAPAAFYDCRVTRMKFGYSARVGETKMNQVAAGVRLEWRGLYYVTEGATNG